MKRTSEATLVERAGFLYRQLLLLQRVFPDMSEDTQSPPFGDDGDARSLCDGVSEVLNRLADDERWRALTKIERREIASLLEGYETLITLIEHEPFRNTSEARDVLQAERERLARFRQDLGFLDRRRLQLESA
jgi:hypothetical protein